MPYLSFTAFSLFALALSPVAGQEKKLPAEEINGRPNYNLGPVKFSAVMAMFWGIAGFAVGLLIAFCPDGPN